MPAPGHSHATHGLRIVNARVPLCLLEGDFPDAGEGLALVDIDVANGAIAGIAPAGTRATGGRRHRPERWAGLDRSGRPAHAPR
jgi:hypothetical protein